MKKYIALFLTVIMAASMTVSADRGSASPAKGSGSEAKTEAPAAVTTSETPEAATAAGLTVEEYANNAVTSLPGVTGTTAVAQQGGVIVNGAATRIALPLVKPSKNEAATAQAIASVIPGGKLLNAVKIGKLANSSTAKASKSAAAANASSVDISTAIVPFFFYGLKATDKVVCFQTINGQIVPVVCAVRADHVDVTGLIPGATLSFVKIQ